MKWLMKAAFMLGSKNKKEPYGSFHFLFFLLLIELRSSETTLPKILEIIPNNTVRNRKPAITITKNFRISNHLSGVS